MNKKGSLSLSINAIVIIVLALTLLGLGLTFVRSVFSDITDTSSGIQEQVKEQILEDLRTGDKKLSFPVTEMKIRSGEDKVIALGIKNIDDSDANFVIDVQIKQYTDGTNSTVDIKSLTKKRFIFDSGEQFIDAGDAQVFPIKITTDRDTTQGTYLVGIKIYTYGKTETEGNKIVYESKGFFVQVT